MKSAPKAGHSAPIGKGPSKGECSWTCKSRQGLAGLVFLCTLTEHGHLSLGLLRLGDGELSIPLPHPTPTRGLGLQKGVYHHCRGPEESSLW